MLSSEFWRLYEGEAERLRRRTRRPGSKIGPTATAPSLSSSSRRASFLRVLWGLSRPTYVSAGLWQLVAVLLQCSVPLLVREVLIRLESNPGTSFA